MGTSPTLSTDIHWFQQKLLSWHHQYGRHNLPWQQNPTPYRVWISEVMLQQTQADTVAPYYSRFMQRFPNLNSLANTSIDEVLSLWTGLGYYARARHLHRAAVLVQTQHQGKLPDTLHNLIKLPGIGRSTAGAILALSANQPTAILDGNAKRVLCRFHQVIGHPAKSAINKRLWQIAEQHTPVQSAAHYTQAIMDLGALVCRRKPQCTLCPLSARCLAFKNQQQNTLPTPAPKKKRPQKERCFLLLHTRDQHILLQKRPSHGLWGGLWSFPEQEKPDQTKNYCQQHWGCVAQSVQTWDNVLHQFSHFTLNITPLVVTIDAIPSLTLPETMHWHALDQVDSLGVPAPVNDLLGQLKKKEKL